MERTDCMGMEEFGFGRMAWRMGYQRRVGFLCWGFFFSFLLSFVAPERLGSSDSKVENRVVTLGRVLFAGTGRRGVYSGGFNGFEVG